VEAALDVAVGFVVAGVFDVGDALEVAVGFAVAVATVGVAASFGSLATFALAVAFDAAATWVGPDCFVSAATFGAAAFAVEVDAGV
jgi:hypothetical protein